MTLRPLAILLGGFLAIAASAPAAEVTLGAARDNTMYEEYPTNSNGAGYLFAGRAGGGGIRRALLRFDIGAAVPAGAHIDEVLLTLTVARTQVADPLPASLQRVLADWGEAGSNAGERAGSGAQAQPGDATWSHRFYATSSEWATPGGDVAPAPSLVTALGGIGTHTLGSSPEMVADVQTWLDDPTSNYGWLLRGDESSAGDARRINSRESPAGTRPSLVVRFTTAAPVPVPPAARALLAAALLALVARAIACKRERA